MGLNMTHTYAEMEVSAAVHEEVKQRLIAAGYSHALHDDGATLDMHGIALTVEPQRELKGGTLEVGHDGRNVVVNHPDLKPDAKGVGHIVFSPAQAEKFAALILKNVKELRGEGAECFHPNGFIDGVCPNCKLRKREPAS